MAVFGGKAVNKVLSIRDNQSHPLIEWLLFSKHFSLHATHITSWLCDQ